MISWVGRMKNVFQKSTISQPVPFVKHWCRMVFDVMGVPCHHLLCIDNVVAVAGGMNEA